MTRTVLLACSAFLVLNLNAFAFCQDGEQSDDRSEEIVGIWVVTSCIYGGVESEGYVDCVFAFDGSGDYLLTTKKGNRVEGKYTVDNDADTRELSLESLYDRPSYGGAGPRLGIFNIKRNEESVRVLTICVAGGGGMERPSEFNSAEDSSIQLMTLVEQ